MIVGRSTLAAILLSACLAAACGGRIGATPTTPPGATPTARPETTAPATPTSTAALERAVRGRADETVRAMKARDFAALATIAHPTKGVRFSPYAFVQLGRDVVLARDVLREGFAHTKRYRWGFTDGKGDPIDATLEQYWPKYVYNKDYAASTDVGFERHPPRGNRIDNSRDAYPLAYSVDYYIPSTDPNTTLDWGGLRLVFEQEAGTWYLVGVIHDEWTI